MDYYRLAALTSEELTTMTMIAKLLFPDTMSNTPNFPASVPFITGADPGLRTDIADYVASLYQQRGHESLILDFSNRSFREAVVDQVDEYCRTEAEAADAVSQLLTPSWSPGPVCLVVLGLSHLRSPCRGAWALWLVKQVAQRSGYKAHYGALVLVDSPAFVAEHQELLLDQARFLNVTTCPTICNTDNVPALDPKRALDSPERPYRQADKLI